MIQRIFIISISILLFGCYDDNDDKLLENLDLRIKKYSEIAFDQNGDPNGQRIEYFFNENGKKTKDHIIDGLGDYFWEYTYNDLGQVTNKSRNYLNYPIDISEEYIYNSENKLDKIYIDSNNDGVVEDSLKFTYHTDKIIAQWYSIGQESKEFYYNNAGILLATKHNGDLGIVIDEDIVYDGDSNIQQLQVTTEFFNTETKNEYEYDGKTNPLYEEFHKFYFNTVWRDGGMLSEYSLFFSPNNITQTIRTGSDVSENFRSLKSYEYNNFNHPIRSETILDGNIIAEAHYEYY